MQETIYDTSDKLFEVDRDILTFTPIESNEYERESSVNVTNISNYPITFRIKTTKKEDYMVNPSHIVVLPQAKITIDFKYLKKKHTGDLSDHKFKLDGFIISNDDKDKDAKQLFLQQEKSKARVKGNVKRMTVSFEGIPAISASFENITKSKNLYSSVTKSQNLYSSVNMINSKSDDILNRDIQLKDELENLKVEYFKLKNRLASLKEKETSLQNRIILENTVDNAIIKPSKS